ncbi:unnamed protein product [Gongylonema pulchrum]|uniref:SERPIN domain-containing protein n=1 Tax=Gongylonema pulchrum TaxID=637853 RepID=A0A183CZV0_9BILA|nr:unnamed protein product [Gongylonema pulchrum]
MCLRKVFESDIRKYHKGEIIRANFRTNQSGIAEDANQWVNKKTHGKISNLISKEEISPETKLMLLNALYFKATWSERFDKSETKEMPFHSAPQKQITVPMMSQSSFFYFFEDSEVKVLGLPYEGEAVYMVILLPKNQFGLANFEKNLNGRKLLDYIKVPRMQRNIDVKLPKFKLEKEMDLSNALKSMGMGTAFSGSANFCGITEHQPLFINRIKHKAFTEVQDPVTVNEDGTEAAAASAVYASDSVPKHKFVADHPFLFAICKHPAKILFLGRYAG